MSRLIRSVECIPVRLPFDHGGPAPLFAGKPRSTMDTVFIRVTLDNGLVGWGESYGATSNAVIDFYQTRLIPLIIGRDATDALLTGTLERMLHNMGRSGLVMHTLSGLDIALWDLHGKLEGVPVHTLLGGAKHTHIKAYASLLQYAGDVPLMQKRIDLALKDGYQAVKLHERTVAPVLGARAVMSADMPLMLDTNCAWDESQANEMLEAMKPANLTWVEEPLWPPEDSQALMRLYQATGVPVAAGENAGHALELCEMTRAKRINYIQPSAIKVGGLTPLVRIAKECEAAQGAVKLAPHCSFFGPSFLATLHLLSTLDNPVDIERIECGLAVSPYSTLQLRSGGFDVPNGPGFGLDPDPDIVSGRYS